MILSEKIIKLRKQLGWSQEELAHKMDVSRQSVSKWESTNSIPDLNKIIKLANLFNVSTDFLLKDDLDTAEYLNEGADVEVQQLSLEDAITYVDHKMSQARLTVKGVTFFVCSAVPLFFMLALSKTEQQFVSNQVAVAVGLVSIFLMVSLGIRFVIKTNQHSRAIAPLEKAPFELAYGVHSAFSEKIDSYLPVYNNRLTLGVTFFVTATVPLLLVAIFIGRADLVLLMLVVLLGIISLGLWLVIPASTQLEALKHILNEGDASREKSQTEIHAEKLAPFYWPLVIAIFLAWSLWTMDWGITWIIFPVAAVLFAALVGLMGLLQKDKSGG